MASTPTKKRARGGSNRHRAADQSHRTELRERMADIQEDVRALAATAGTAARDQLDPVEQYVRDKPVKSLLIAAGIGAVLSFVFLRR